MAANIHNQFRLPAKNGQTILFQQVTTESKALIQRGLEEMSPESRYLRFMHPVNQLSEKELEYFTNIDQVNHVAWAALEELPTGLHGLGIGRYVRSSANEDCAEFALAVIDKYQSMGIGSTLLATLYIMARLNGITCLSGYVLPSNLYAIDKLKEIGATVSIIDHMYQIHLPVMAIEDLPDTPFARQLASLLASIEQRLILPSQI